ncbi:basic proline-rich protein-like [Oenanthe melanoleuca]|uniref:basic proline-rich protein-like n=1 Tax=Oenanthe melanoleuca TaxID=2939378 RepID=UPI0024C1623F|nr:basic proline-rich protein-like [Oenanthe melanoleuca]
MEKFQPIRESSSDDSPVAGQTRSTQCSPPGPRPPRATTIPPRGPPKSRLPIPSPSVRKTTPNLKTPIPVSTLLHPVSGGNIIGFRRGPGCAPVQAQGVLQADVLHLEAGGRTTHASLAAPGSGCPSDSPPGCDPPPPGVAGPAAAPVPAAETRPVPGMGGATPVNPARRSRPEPPPPGREKFPRPPRLRAIPPPLGVAPPGFPMRRH